jgi:hypothetical protein
MDGQLVLARGDHGRRAAIWNVVTGARIFEIGADDARRESLRASIANVAGRELAFVTTQSRKTALVQHTLPDGREGRWLSTRGMLAFDPERVVGLTGSWIAVYGHGYSEQYDTVVAVDIGVDDVEALQTALREKPAIKQWGYRVAIGPAGAEQVVVYRDAEWTEDDVPEDPDEAFCGIEIWDLRTSAVVERIAHHDDVPAGTNIGANVDHVAIEMPEYVTVFSRRSGSSRRIPCLALDPYRLTVARRDGDQITIDSITDIP